MSTAQIIEGKWEQTVGHVKKKWGLLTDDDLTETEGNYQLLVGKIQEKTGKAREEIEEYLSEIAHNEADMIDHIRETAEDYGEAAKQLAAGASDSIREQYHHLGDEARRQYDAAGQKVRQNPAESVAVCFGIGMLAGLMIGMVVRSR